MEARSVARVAAVASSIGVFTLVLVQAQSGCDGRSAAPSEGAPASSAEPAPSAGADPNAEPTAPAQPSAPPVVADAPPVDPAGDEPTPAPDDPPPPETDRKFFPASKSGVDFGLDGGAPPPSPAQRTEPPSQRQRAPNANPK